MKRVLLGFAAIVLALFGPVLLACPVALSKAQLKRLDAEDMRIYAVQRWLKCGFAEAEPALRFWRNEATAQERRERRADPEESEFAGDAFVDEIYGMVVLNPVAIPDELARLDPGTKDGDIAALAELLLLRADEATVRRHFDDSLPALVSWLRKEVPSGRDPATSAMAGLELDLVLIKRLVRQGEIAAAREELERIERRWHSRAASMPIADKVKGDISRLRQVLQAVAPRSAAPSRTDWTLNRSRGGFICGTPYVQERRYGVQYLRDYVLRAADTDAAIAELLDTSWRSEIAGDASHTLLLAELLRRRHDDAALKQGWIDALATLRADEHGSGLQLFGQFLPLASALIEDDAPAPGSTRERRFTQEELVALVLATPLYRSLHRQGIALE